MWIRRIVLGWMLAACGGGDGDGLDPGAQVGALADGQLRSLCHEFAGEVCAAPDGPGCAASCCDGAAIPAAMRQECVAPITVDDVRDCAAAFAAQSPDAMDICVQRMGGCVFDVLDTCSGS